MCAHIGELKDGEKPWEDPAENHRQLGGHLPQNPGSGERERKQLSPQSFSPQCAHWVLSELRRAAVSKYTLDFKKKKKIANYLIKHTVY